MPSLCQACGALPRWCRCGAEMAEESALLEWRMLEARAKTRAEQVAWDCEMYVRPTADGWACDVDATIRNAMFDVWPRLCHGAPEAGEKEQMREVLRIREAYETRVET